MKTLNEIIQKYQDESDYCEEILRMPLHETTRNYWEGRIISLKAMLLDLTNRK